MTILSTTVIDKTEILENGIIQVRQAEIITKDGNEIGRNFTRWVRTPGDTLAQSDPAPIPAIANVIWTESVISAYQAEITKKTNISQ